MFAQTINRYTVTYALSQFRKLCKTVQLSNSTEAGLEVETSRTVVGSEFQINIYLYFAK